MKNVALNGKEVLGLKKTVEVVIDTFKRIGTELLACGEEAKKLYPA